MHATFEAYSRFAQFDMKRIILRGDYFILSIQTSNNHVVMYHMMNFKLTEE